MLCTFKAQNTLCAVLSLSCVICHIHIHRAYAPALAAGDAFARITFYSEQ